MANRDTEIFIKVAKRMGRYFFYKVELILISRFFGRFDKSFVLSLKPG